MSNHRRHKRTGHLFEGRFCCRVVEDRSDAWTVSRYAHRNSTPVLVAHPAEWPWSSYPGYCQRELRPWVRYDEWGFAWKGEFGTSTSYREFVEERVAGPRTSPFRDTIDGWILGSKNFAARIRHLVSPSSHEPDVLSARISRAALTSIVEAASRVQRRLSHSQR